MSANGGKELGMAEGKVKRSIAAHGDAGDGAIGTTGSDAVAFLDEREKLLKEEIFVAFFSHFCVDVKGCAGIGSGDQEILQFAFVAHIFHQIPCARVY